MNKYEVKFSIEATEKNITRLINQIWKLIPMRENLEDWEKQLETLIVEIVGLNEIFYKQPPILQALSKMEGLKARKDLSFEFFRKTVFEIIGLVQGLKHALK